jgi:small-conductance mechanosensitive channel
LNKETMTATAQALTASASVSLTATAQVDAEPWYQILIQHNSAESWGYSLGLFLLLWLLQWVFKRIVLQRLKVWAEKTETDLDDFLLAEIEKIGLMVYLPVSLYMSTRRLDLTRETDKVLMYVMVIALTFRAVRFVQSLLYYMLEKSVTNREGDNQAQMANLKSFRWLMDGMVWAIAILFLLSNFGVNISSVVAGLGIGGIAIALGLQTLLKDLIASLSILSDKPFKVGDFIVLGNDQGTVEAIGLRSTRVRSNTGELLIIPNGDLTAGRVRNFKQMQERRQVLKIGIKYETAPDKVAEVSALLEEIISATPGVRFDRAHFAGFGDWALLYECVYYAQSSDYKHFMDANQSIYLRILARFKEHGVEFAYPTQSLVLPAQGSHPVMESSRAEKKTRKAGQAKLR